MNVCRRKPLITDREGDDDADDQNGNHGCWGEIREVFLDPFGPNNAYTEPDWMSSSTSSTVVVCPYAYLSRCVCTIAMLVTQTVD